MTDQKKTIIPSALTLNWNEASFYDSDSEEVTPKSQIKGKEEAFNAQISPIIPKEETELPKKTENAKNI